MAAVFAGRRLIAGKRLNVQLESIEVVAVEGGNQDAAYLSIVPGHFKFLNRAAHREIVNHYLPLIDGTLRHSPQLAKLQIIQVLDAHPDAGSHHCQHKSERAPRGPKQEEAEHGKHGGDCVKNDYDLA